MILHEIFANHFLIRELLLHLHSLVQHHSLRNTPLTLILNVPTSQLRAELRIFHHLESLTDRLEHIAHVPTLLRAVLCLLILVPRLTNTLFLRALLTRKLLTLPLSFVVLVIVVTALPDEPGRRFGVAVFVWYLLDFRNTFLFALGETLLEVTPFGHGDLLNYKATRLELEAASLSTEEADGVWDTRWAGATKRCFRAFITLGETHRGGKHHEGEEEQ